MAFESARSTLDAAPLPQRSAAGSDRPMPRDGRSDPAVPAGPLSGLAGSEAGADATMGPARYLPVHELSTDPVVQRAMLRARAERNAYLRSLGAELLGWVAGLGGGRSGVVVRTPLQAAD